MPQERLGQQVAGGLKSGRVANCGGYGTAECPGRRMEAVMAETTCTLKGAPPFQGIALSGLLSKGNATLLVREGWAWRTQPIRPLVVALRGISILPSRVACACALIPATCRISHEAPPATATTHAHLKVAVGG